MKFILILACLTLFVALTQGQRSCRGRVPTNQQNCLGGRDVGSGRRRQCRINANDNMWFYSRRSRSCRRMAYRGCGGNNNRYCSLEACERKCRRIVTTIRTTSTTAPQPEPQPDSTTAPQPQPEPQTEPQTSPQPEPETVTLPSVSVEAATSTN